MAFREKTGTQQALARPYEGLLKLASEQAQQGQWIFLKTSINTFMKKINSATLVVADTSGLMSLLVDTDANHHKALTLSILFDESPGTVIIPSHVFSELMNVVGKKLGHQVAVAIGHRILSDPTYLILESDEELAEAIERFAQQPSSVSFTDCLVMTLADRVGTKMIFGFDEVFRKNGYRLPTAPKQNQAA